MLGELGMVGQRRLKGSSVLCVGSGGLGSPALLYLAAAGVGRIGVIDNDVVDISNLQRQVIHGLATVGTYLTFKIDKTSIDYHVLYYRIARHTSH